MLIQASKLISRQDTSMSVVAELTHELLATSMSDPEGYKDYIGAEATELQLLEEVSSLPEDPDGEMKGVTVFHRDDNGIFMWPYQFQGFLKAAGDVLRQAHGDEKLTGSKGTKWGAMKGKIDRFVVIRPDKIYLTRDGAPIMEPDGICTRPLRAMTAKGERVSINRSESVSAGAQFKLEIDLMEGAPITEMMLVEMLAYGERVGMLQWRNSGKGRFIASIDAAEGWTPSEKLPSKAKS